MSKNLLYYSSFGGKPSTVFITASALLSSKRFKNDDFDILLYCNDSLYKGLNKFFPGILDGILVWRSYCVYFSAMDESTWSRYDIFSWIDIDNYDNILYLDTDTIVSGDPSILFSLISKSISPVLSIEAKSSFDKVFHGQSLYKLYKKDFSRSKQFCTGVLLFKNCPEVKNVFQDVGLFLGGLFNNLKGILINLLTIFQDLISQSLIISSTKNRLLMLIS